MVAEMRLRAEGPRERTELEFPLNLISGIGHIRVRP